MENETDWNKYIEVFLEENSKVNLISKNDEKVLFEKHIIDSIAAAFVFEAFSLSPETLLDIGTGGGFPAVPVAIIFPEIKVTAVDSIAKKIRAIENIKQKLHINNLNPVCSRVENMDGSFDIVTARAVASLDKLCTLALPKLNKDGYFIAYKSKKCNEEIEAAKHVLKKFKAEVADIFEYNLPLDVPVSRNLVIIKFK